MELMLDFPVLKNKAGSFLEGVTYSVVSYYNNNKLKVIHTLTGSSFIRDLIKNHEAGFHVSLYFKENAERQSTYVLCNEDDIQENKIVVAQSIKLDFSYAPEITPNIVTLNNTEFAIDNNSGLSDFWDIGHKLDIPSFTRIASCGTLEHSSGNISRLISPTLDKSLPDGAMKVEVSINATEYEKAVRVLCATDVHNIFRSINIGTKQNWQSSEDSFKLSLITQILCAMYGEIKHQTQQKNEITNSGLLAHLDELQQKTSMDWMDEDFNPSLAATKMFPYISNFKGGE